ncbi:MAG: hypothetical protein D6687_02440 [Acidobacteria bacterium]|jgi:hypothetical protein|nr:MAG: hypothetical protein D6687_02440 [Acidobacteriota bacterium]GIU81769.1 MAG: hypothetical protein KatS3mg006_0833 [Pyrinomonadaceae bacterium]
MNKNYRIERRRVFLFQDLPEGLMRSSEHLQFFDNYLQNTRLRIRSIRSPKTKQWSYVLEQRIQINENDFSVWYVNEMQLDEAEHSIFEQFEELEIEVNGQKRTNELRFNRYFYKFNDKQIELDIFLRPLWGLNLAKVFFESEDEMRAFRKPDFLLLEVTQMPFFLGKNLVGKTLEDVKEYLQSISESVECL